MAACVRLTIEASGGGPWGFRLYGGEDEPLVVAKLRKRSKAHDAGLQEGDCILGINSYSCQGISHATAMALVDGTGDLSLEIVRGTTDQNAINAAFQELGPKLRPVPASALPQGASPAPRASQPSPAQPQAAPAQSLPKFQPQAQYQPQQQNQVVNGFSGAPQPVKFDRREQTFRDGDTTTHVTTETSEERMGGTTVTKIKRETVSQSYGQAPSQPMFKVANVAPGGGSAPKKTPGTWNPVGGNIAVNVSDNVHVQRNPDQSVTMTIGFGDSKENIAPEQPKKTAPMFKVSKFGSNTNAPAANKPAWEQNQAPAKPQPSPNDLPLLPDEEAEYKAKLDALQKPYPVQLQRILVESGVSDPESGGSDSPTYLTRRRMDSFEMESDEDDFFNQKKKIFSDSAFYDDPEHKYPTIDEQVKMARKVAMSLLAPANKKARGHRMFMRRMVKSQKWTADEDQHEKDFDWTDGTEEEKYYRPDPWAQQPEQNTWAPPEPAAPPQAPQAPMPPPVAPPLPTNLFKPTLPFTGPKKDEKMKALSADEFERMRLFESKTDHTQVSPQMCFSLANDLRSMKGKGGKLFAKRVARSEKWDTESDKTAEKINKPNQDLINKIAMQAAAAGATHNPMAEMMNKSAAPSSSASQGPPVNRLKDMIDPPKPKMSPWDAAAEFGSTEEAFVHLKGYNPYGRSQQGQLADSLDFAAQKGPGPASGAAKPAPVSSLPTSGQPAKLPADYKPAAKPWASSHDSSSSASGASQPSSSFMDTSSSSGKGFRPVGFKAPGSHTGNFQPANSKFEPSPARSTGSSYGGGASFGGGNSEPVGFCDL